MARHLRPIQSNTDPTIVNKLAMALAYIMLGGLVTLRVFNANNLIMLFMLLGFLYWMFIGRNPRKSKYFIRYHLVQSILLNLVLATAIWLLMEFMALLQLMIPATDIVFKMLIQPLPNALFNLSILQMLTFGLNLVLAGYCLAGQETEVPYISDGVRYWVRW